MKLIDYLRTLDTVENQWSLYLDPDNIDDYRIGQNCFENGGLLDDKIKVANLDQVSFGSQSTFDAIESWLSNQSEISYKGKSVKFIKSGILEAYSRGLLDEDFEDFLESQAYYITDEWSKFEAEFWVFDTLPAILAESAEEISETP